MMGSSGSGSEIWSEDAEAKGRDIMGQMMRTRARTRRMERVRYVFLVRVTWGGRRDRYLDRDLDLEGEGGRGRDIFAVSQDVVW